MATNWTVVADQDSVDQVDSKIGESSDNETKQTVFGRLWGIRNVVDWCKTWLTDKLDMKISNLPQGIVKSVQRGITSITNYTTTVDIGSVDLNKSILILENGNFSNSATECMTSGYFISNTSLFLYTTFRHSAAGVQVPWQVIEFY